MERALRVDMILLGESLPCAVLRDDVRGIVAREKGSHFALKGGFFSGQLQHIMILSMGRNAGCSPPYRMVRMRGR